MPDVFSTLEDVDTRVVLDYTSRDFTAIRAQLVGLAKGLMPEWETAGEAPDFGTLLLELFAYMGDVMHFYIDRTASEAFLGTALRRQSVLYIADMMGYTPIGQQAAIVALKFSLDPNQATELIDAAATSGTDPVLVIPAGTMIHNEASSADDVIFFELNGPVSLDPTDVTRYKDIDGYATEGITADSDYMGLGTGAPSTELILPHKGVIYGTVSIRTTEGAQSVGWDYTSDIVLARPTQAMFTTFLDDQNNTHVLFGDNSSGRIPPVNAKIYATYRYGVGVAANRLAASTLTSLVSPPNSNWWGVSVTNPAPPVGGTDPESVDAMRQSIPRAAGRIKNRAITLNDYADLALQVPGVAKSVSHGTVYTAVHVVIAPNDGQGDDVYLGKLCDQVESYMADKVIVGSTVYAEPAHMDDLWLNVYIQITVHVQDGYNRNSVRVTVDEIVRQVLDFDNVDFGTRVSMGTIYRAVLSVPGVEWADLEWLNTEPPVDADADQDVTTLASLTYLHDPSTTLATPVVSAGTYRRNHATTPTAFAFSATANVGTADLMTLKEGDHIVYRPQNDEASWMSLVLSGPPVNNTTWIQVPVIKVDEADTVAAPVADAPVLFEFLRYAPTPDSLAPVQDIVTPPLLIPRIFPPLNLKTATVTDKALSANIASLTTETAHGLERGDIIDVSNVDAVFNGRHTVEYVSPAVPTSLGFPLTHANVPSAPVTNGLIKQVDPTSPESEADYPDMTEAERTHDGLWVKAVGGVTGT